MEKNVVKDWIINLITAVVLIGVLVLSVIPL
jgi:hypothetical protein